MTAHVVDDDGGSLNDGSGGERAQEVYRSVHSASLLEVHLSHGSSSGGVDGLCDGRLTLSVELRAFRLASFVAETDTTDTNVVDEDVAREKELELLLVDPHELLAEIYVMCSD